MSLSLPRSVSTAAVAPDRDAAIGLTMAATIVTVAIAAAVGIRVAEAIAVRVMEAIGTATVDQLLTVTAIVLSLGIAVGAGTLAARDADWVRPTPARADSR